MGKIKLDKFEQSAEEVILNKTKYKPIQNDDVSKRKEDKRNKLKSLKNIILLSLSYFFQYSALNGLNNLQSSLNSEKNLGITAMLLTSVVFTISCLFLPMIMTKYVGYKWSIIGANISITVFTIANFYPRFYTLLPAAFLSGLGQCIQWTLQGSFIAQLASIYSKATKKTQEVSLVRFYGIFLMIFQLRNLFK